jgi:biotin operon repressor
MAITLLMKMKMLQAIIQHPAVKPSGVEVAARLLNHLNTRSLQCNPSYASLADATGISRDTVMASVQDLEAAGFLKVKRSVELGTLAAKGQRLPSNSFEFDFSKIARSEKPTTSRRKSRLPQSEFPTTPVENPDHPQSENTGEGSLKSRPKAGKEETGNLETGNRTQPAVAGQLALLDQTISDATVQKQKRGNGKKRTRKTKTDLPDDWVLSVDQWNYGAQLKLTAPEIDESQRKLKRYVKREGIRSADWNTYIEDWLEREKVFITKGQRRSGEQDDKAGFDDYRNGGDHRG